MKALKPGKYCSTSIVLSFLARLYNRGNENLRLSVLYFIIEASTEKTYQHSDSNLRREMDDNLLNYKLKERHTHPRKPSQQSIMWADSGLDVALLRLHRQAEKNDRRIWNSICFSSSK